LEIAPVDEFWLNQGVCVMGGTYVHGTWVCRDTDGKPWRSGNPRYDAEALCSRLRSPDFLNSYRAAAVARHHHLSELFDAAGGHIVCGHHRNKEPVYPRDVFYVYAGFSERFSVHEATYAWSDWLQQHLPFMPNRMALARIAGERSQDATDVLDAQIRRSFPDLELQTSNDS
jgi:hypothetical protein